MTLKGYSPAAAGTATTASNVTITDTNNYYSGTSVEAALDQLGAQIVAIQNNISNPPSGNALLSGGGIAWQGGLDFTVSAATYSIQGVEYSSAQTDLSLSAADPTDPRIDVFALTTSGTVIIVEGTASSTPVKPDIDPTTQLELSFAYVAAGATEVDITTRDVYHENTEWVTSRSGTTNTLASTNNPNAGSVCIEGTAVTGSNYFQFQNASAIDLGVYDNLVFYIRSKASWGTQGLAITARLNNTQVGQTVSLTSGKFGFNSATTGVYQQVVIPLSLFGVAGLSVNQLRFTHLGTGTIGYYVDDVSLQGNVQISLDRTALRWRGVYSATALYVANDVVAYTGTTSGLYVANTSTTNTTPGVSANWSTMLDVTGYANKSLVNVFTKQQYTTPYQLGSSLSGTITIDASQSNVFEGTTTGNATLANPTNAADGMNILVRLTVGGAGSYTMSYGTNWHFIAGTPTWPTTVGDVIELSATYYASNTKWEATANASLGTAVTNSTTLTSNALVLGNGSASVKVAAGLTTDGTSAVNLGVAGASVGKVVVSNATSGSITLQPVTGALGTQTISIPASTGTMALTSDISASGTEMKGLTFTSDTSSTADSDPGNGKFKWDNATQASATTLYFDNQTADGVSTSTYWAALGSSGFLYMQQSDDATKWQLWKWTATPTDGTGYYKFTVTLMANGGSITTGKTVYTQFSSAGSGGGSVNSKTISASKTRPADTNAYTAGDVFNESTSAGTVLTFSNFASANGGGALIQSAQLIYSTNPAAGSRPDFKLFLFDTTPTVQNDNVAFAPSDGDMETCVGVLYFSVGAWTPGSGNAVVDLDNLGKQVTCTGSSTTIYGVLVVNNAYTPASGDKATVRLQIVQTP